MTQLDAVEGLNAADVMNRHVTTVPASATVGDLRAYFATSSSRHLAVLVDGARYVAALTPSSIPDGIDDASPALDYATREPTIDQSAPAARARDLALLEPSQRLPVIDDAGTLVGIVAINKRRDGFCST